MKEIKPPEKSRKADLNSTSVHSSKQYRYTIGQRTYITDVMIEKKVNNFRLCFDASAFYDILVTRSSRGRIRDILGQYNPYSG